MKKVLTIAVASATILWTAGLAAFVPTQAKAAEYGDLIMGETLSTVYYYGSDGQRYSFPNEKTYFSWYEDFDDVVQISDEDLADITLAGNIVYRPGSHWIKIESDEKVYAVSTDGSIHWVESEEVAEGLAGSDWNMFIDDVPDVFFVDYTVGDSLDDASMGYDGMLWSDGSSTYHIMDGEYHMVTDDGMEANMFQDGFVLMGDGVDLDSLTEGDDIDSESASLTDAAQMVEGDEYEETEYIDVSVSDDSPAASTYIAGQALAHVVSYDFENPTSEDVVVTGLSLDRTGVSSDTTLAAVYLFDGYMRESDSATVSSGTISWNDTGDTGLFVIPAGETKTIDVRTHVAASTGGQTFGLDLLDESDVEFDGANEASGSFPLESEVHTVATLPSNFATFAFATASTPSANTSLDPQDDYRLWEETVTVGNNEVYLYSASFRNIGSVDAEDVQNWQLYVAGTQAGDDVAQQESVDGYVTFDLSADPVKMNTGSHVVKVLADIIGGSTRTVTVGLRDTADIFVTDEDYEEPILVTGNTTSTTAAFAAQDAGAQTISSGEVTFTKTTDSASGDIIDGASNVSLGSFTVRATGEAMKIENLPIQIDEDDADTTYTLRNGALYVDGTQVGSTTAIAGDTDSTLAYTSFTFGSSFIVYPGSPVTLEIRADAYNSDGTDDVDANDTIQVQIDGGSPSSNVLRKVSGSYISRPAADVEGNILTVRTGALTTANNSSYAAQSAVAPKTQYKVGSWTVTANTTEAVNLTTFDVDFSAAASDASAAADYTNLYITYGPDGDENTSNTKTTVSLTTNSWSTSYTLDAGETIYVNAYADVATSVTDDSDGDDIITADLDVDATASSSATSIDGSDVSASAITWYTAGSFTSAVGGATPVAKDVAAGQTIEAAQFKLTAVRESFNITQMEFEVGTAAAAGVISSVMLYDGSTLLGSAVMSETPSNDTGDGETDGTAGLSALITGLDIDVAAGTNKTLTAKLALNDIGSGMASSQNNLALTLDYMRYTDSQGTVQTGATSYTDRAGNEIRAYNSLPTVSAVDLTNSTLVNGQAIDLYKFTVSANSNGSIALKQLALPISYTDSDADTMCVNLWKLYKNGTDVSTSSSAVVLEDEDGEDIEGGTSSACSTPLAEGDTTVYIIWDTNEEVITAGETVTYTLRATPVGFDSDGDTGDEDYFTIYLAGDSAHNQATNADICLEDAGAGEIWQLDNQVSSACTTASSNNTAYNFIWSDNSGESHDASSETGSGDWTDGYLVLNLDLAGETWAK